MLSTPLDKGVEATTPGRAVLVTKFLGASGRPQHLGRRGCFWSRLLQNDKLCRGNVARDPVATVDDLYGGRRFVADRSELARAACRERAAAWEFGRARRRAFEHDAMALRVGVGRRHRREQRLGIRVPGRCEDLACGAELDDAAEIH